MITTGAKFFFGLAALALAGAAVFAWSNHGGLSGVLTGGLYGGVGDHAGYAVLLRGRGGRCSSEASRSRSGTPTPTRSESFAGVDTLPEVREPRSNSYWPVLGAVAAACCVVGLVVNPQLFVFGILVGAVVLLEWMVSAWSERATGDAGRQPPGPQPHHPAGRDPGVRRNRHRRARVLRVSRPAWRSARTPRGSSRSASPRSCLLLGWVFAASPKSTRTAIAVICILGFLGVIAGGVISAAEGSRDYEKHEQEKPFVPPDRNQPIPTTLPEN